MAHNYQKSINFISRHSFKQEGLSKMINYFQSLGVIFMAFVSLFFLYGFSTKKRHNVKCPMMMFSDLSE